MKIEPNRIHSLLFQQVELAAPDMRAANQFGYSIDLHDRTLVVGAPLKSSAVLDQARAIETLPGAGAAYVFRHDGNDWVLQARLQASNKQAGAEFGRSIAISDNTIIVGAPFEGANLSGGDADLIEDQVFNSGAVYVFVRVDNHWVQQARLQASNISNGMAFGESVALSDDVLVVGAPGEASKSIGVNGDQQDHSTIYAGAAYVFVCESGLWQQEAYLKACNTNELDQFGSAVAVCGNTIAVGAPNEDSGLRGDPDDNSACAAGAVYVFARDLARNWIQQAYLKAPDVDAGDHFGFAVDLDGNRIVVGAPFKGRHAAVIDSERMDEPASNVGAAYVYERYASSWAHDVSLKASIMEADRKFGYSVSVSGDSIVVGAPFQSHRTMGSKGGAEEASDPDGAAAHVFRRKENGLWSQQALLKTLCFDTGSQFGCAVAVDDAAIAIGARFGHSHSEFNAADRIVVQSGKVCLFYWAPYGLLA